MNIGMVFFVLVSIVLPALLMLAGITMAWKTRSRVSKWNFTSYMLFGMWFIPAAAVLIHGVQQLFGQVGILHSL